MLVAKVASNAVLHAAFPQRLRPRGRALASGNTREVQG